jgi:cysteine desulfurase/selenocysteine lyase
MSATYSPALTEAEARAFEAARARFPGALTQSYIDVASRGLMPGNAPQLAHDHLMDRVHGRADKKAYFETVERARAGIARLIGARSDEIAITKNISDGLNMVATAIDWRAGDEVFLCSGVEHPSNIYVWRNLEKLGVKVRDFTAADGEFPTDAVIQALEGRHQARVVTVSGTSFVPGFRADLERLGAACRAAGAHLVVDGAQTTGITHVDMERMPVDAFAMSTQKGLCSVYGMGFLYVRTEFAQALSPRYLSRFGVDISATHEADYDPGPVNYQRGALRFDLGNYNFLAAALAVDTLDLLSGLGTSAIDRHVTALAGGLAERLREAGAPVRGAAPGRRANIVCIESSQGPGPVAQLQRHLKECNVQAALRRNVVRFSFHFYNNAGDVQAAEAACTSWLRKNAQTLM